MLGCQRVQCHKTTGANSHWHGPRADPLGQSKGFPLAAATVPAGANLTGQIAVIPGPNHIWFPPVTALHGPLAAHLPQGHASPAPGHDRTTCPIPVPSRHGGRRTALRVERSQTPRRWPDG